MRYVKDPPLHESRIRRDVSALKKFSGWKREGKKYLIQQTGDIDLLEMIDEYHKLVIGFHDWFIQRQKEIHHGDIEKVNTKRKELAALLIPHEVIYALADIQSSNRSVADAFAVLLTPQQRTELASIPTSSTEYPAKLISFVEQWAPLDEDLKRRIREVCR